MPLNPLPDVPMRNFAMFVFLVPALLQFLNTFLLSHVWVLKNGFGNWKKQSENHRGPNETAKQKGEAYEN